MAGSDAEPPIVQLYAPLHPERVRAATFPAYDAIHADLRRVLDRSTLDEGGGPGAALYDALTNTQKAGLLNLFAKMSAVALAGERTVWALSLIHI